MPNNLHHVRKILISLALLVLASLACGRVSTAAVIAPDLATARPAAAIVAMASPVATIKPVETCVATGDLNVRNQPGADKTVIAWLHAGDRVANIAKIGEWRQVKLSSGVSGFAHGSWLNCEVAK